MARRVWRGMSCGRGGQRHHGAQVRFELEQALLNSSLPVDDLPAEWNAKYKEYLGVEPPSDKEGVLQDIHWSDGSFGYFPTYTLGAMFACQFFEVGNRLQSRAVAVQCVVSEQTQLVEENAASVSCPQTHGR